MKKLQTTKRVIKFLDSIFPIKIAVGAFIIFIILAFIFFKGYQTYLYFSHKVRAGQAIVWVQNLHTLCANNRNIEKTNPKYFYQQQKLAIDAIAKFYVGDYHIWGSFFGRQFEDEDEIFYKGLMHISHADCSELLKFDPKKLEEQQEHIENKMFRKILWFF